MKEYDRLGQKWVPYLMYFHEPNYISDVINTDSRGFRVSYKNDEKISEFGNADNRDKCLLIGGSFVFGVGSTSDKTTIPSVLNSITDDTWINFSGRAFNSTQELLLFLFYYRQIKNIKRIVILSGGVNNLVLYYMSRNYSRELGSFFFSNEYSDKMNRNALSLKRRMARALLAPILGNSIDYSRITKEELLKYLATLGKGAGVPMLKEELKKAGQKEDMLYVLERDIRLWKIFTEPLGIDLHYVLQPFTEWYDKKLSKEEALLFGALDNMPQSHWKVIKDNMQRDQYKWLLNNVKGICKSSGVKFFDMNQAMAERNLDEKWLYVDRVHFADGGNSAVAQILKEQVIGR